MKIFSYGSNMLTERLTAKNRAPSAVRSSTGWVRGAALRFHKRSIDGSGKCDMYQTGMAADVVWGAVFEVPDSEIGQLRTAEGEGDGYHESSVQVEFPAGCEESVTAFIADADAINSALRPYIWYWDLVVAGAEEHGLPMEYIAILRATAAMEDPDPSRKTKVEAEEALSRHRANRLGREPIQS